MNVVKDTALKVRILPDADAVAREAAKVIAADARTAVTARGRFIVAVSGGHTPWQMRGTRHPARQKQLSPVQADVLPGGDVPTGVYEMEDFTLLGNH